MKHNSQLDPVHVKLQIDQLKLIYPDEDEDFWLDLLAIGTDLHAFLDKVETRRQEAVALADAIKTRVDDLRERKSRMDRRDEVCRKLEFNIMQAAHLRKLEMPIATLSIRTNPPKTIIVDEAELPDAMCKIVRVPDKMKIKDALQNGEQVPGAALSNADETIAVRIK